MSYDAPAVRWVIHKLTKAETREMIERHIDFVDKDSNSVRLPDIFVEHYMNRDDGALPTMSAISALPLVTADGHIMCADGLDRKTGIFFPPDALRLRNTLPERRDCDTKTVAAALRFLTEDWLANVATASPASASYWRWHCPSSNDRSWRAGRCSS